MGSESTEINSRKRARPEELEQAALECAPKRTRQISGAEAVSAPTMVLRPIPVRTPTFFGNGVHGGQFSFRFSASTGSSQTTTSPTVSV